MREALAGRLLGTLGTREWLTPKLGLRGGRSGASRYALAKLVVLSAAREHLRPPDSLKGANWAQ